jgi:GNAT superfamily N-acetyltransferase
MREPLGIPGLVVDTDPERIDFPLVHSYLSRDSYWAKGLPEAVFRKAIANSVCFGVYAGDGKQVAFCRVVTDCATFGWLCDVFVVPEHQGKGISKRLMEKVMGHPDLQGFRRFILGTRSAHSLYARYGFKPLAKPEIYMEIWDPEVYLRKASIAAPDSSG